MKCVGILCCSVKGADEGGRERDPYTKWQIRSRMRLTESQLSLKDSTTGSAPSVKTQSGTAPHFVHVSVENPSVRTGLSSVQVHASGSARWTEGQHVREHIFLSLEQSN